MRCVVDLLLSVCCDLLLIFVGYFVVFLWLDFIYCVCLFVFVALCLVLWWFASGFLLVVALATLCLIACYFTWIVVLLFICGLFAGLFGLGFVFALRTLGLLFVLVLHL